MRFTHCLLSLFCLVETAYNIPTIKRAHYLASLSSGRNKVHQIRAEASLRTANTTKRQEDKNNPFLIATHHFAVCFMSRRPHTNKPQTCQESPLPLRHILFSTVHEASYSTRSRDSVRNCGECQQALGHNGASKTRDRNGT